MQMICTTLQTDKPRQYPITQFFYGLDALPDAQPTVSKLHSTPLTGRAIKPQRQGQSTEGSYFRPTDFKIHHHLL